MEIHERLDALRKEMEKEGIDVYYFNTSDYHMSEYVPEYFRTIAYFSGFRGSLATLLVDMQKAVLFVDGRYHLQADQQSGIYGIEIVKLGILNFSQDEGFRTALPQAAELDIEDPYDPEKKLEDVKRLAPDILLTNYQSEMDGVDIMLDTIPMCPDVGFFSGLEMIERWTRIFGSGQEGDWTNDRHLLEKYYAR